MVVNADLYLFFTYSLRPFFFCYRVARQYRTDFIMQIFKDEDMPQCSSGAGRKRPFRAEEVTSSQAQEEVFKKARKGIWFVCLMASTMLSRYFYKICIFFFV